MPRIAFIGAGSYGFTYKLTVDILSYPELADSEMVYMDVDETRLTKLKTIITEYMKNTGKDPEKAKFILDRQQALEGADFVINLVKIGFLEASVQDTDVPKKFGMKQTIGDTCGLAGIFRGLRTMPFCIRMCHEIEDLSNDGAVVLNYTNPQSMLVLATAMASHVPFIGLCHSVQGTTRTVANYMDIPYDELEYDAAGINHMAWITKLEHKSRDVYPDFIEKVRKEGIFSSPEDNDDVKPKLGTTRLDMLMRIGYMVTESSTHFPEYLPYYLRDEEHIKKYGIHIDQFKDNISRKEKKYEELYQKAAKGELEEAQRSVEYGSSIIHSMTTGEVCKIYGNVPNTGLIDNLPDYSAVEVPCLVDRNGVQPVHFGELPTVCAALCTTNILAHQLAAEAIVEGDRDKVYHALMLDPLTNTMLDLDQMKQVADELIEKQKEYLGEYLAAAD